MILKHFPTYFSFKICTSPGVPILLVRSYDFDNLQSSINKQALMKTAISSALVFLLDFNCLEIISFLKKGLKKFECMKSFLKVEVSQKLNVLHF